MLNQPAPFPFIGSQGFERGTGRPLTIIQLRADGRALCRREDESRPGAALGGIAKGNFTLDLADLCESEAEANDTALAKARRTRRRSARK